MALYCDSDLLQLFNKTFPLPNQKSWTVFHPSNAVFMKVVSVLRTKVTDMDGWRRLPAAGKSTGRIGLPSANLWDWTLTYREGSGTTETKSAQLEPSELALARATLVEDVRYEVAQSLACSRPLARRSNWCMS